MNLAVLVNEQRADHERRLRCRVAAPVEQRAYGLKAPDESLIAASELAEIPAGLQKRLVRIRAFAGGAHDHRALIDLQLRELTARIGDAATRMREHVSADLPEA